MKRIAAILLAVFMVIQISGCATSDDEKAKKTMATTTDKEDLGNIEDMHLRDKDLLYSMYDSEKVETMYLTVSSGNSAENSNHTWEEINTYSVYDYDKMNVERYKVEGLLQVGDEKGQTPGELGYNQVSPNCTVQVRGQTSSKLPQKNYKIKIKKNKGEWRGQTTIALNKHQGEGLRFRNKLVFDLISGKDELMGLRTTFVHLYVKDTTSDKTTFEDYGLYTQVEQLNKTALKTHGLDSEGHLYKINSCEFYKYEDAIKLTSDPTYNKKKFEEILEIKGDDDHGKLIDFLAELNDYSISADTIIDKYLDIENVAYWMAFHILIGNADTQNRNFYIYSPTNSKKWYILNWDCDGSLRRTEYKVIKKVINGGWEEGVSNYWGNILFQRCLKSDRYRKALDKAIEDLKNYLSPERVGGLANSYAEIVKPYIYKMPDIENAPLTPSEYDYVIENISSDIEENYKAYKECYNKPMPFYMGVPQKMGDKISVLWDNAYDFDAETITYTFELAKDYLFKETILKYDNLKLPMAKFDNLPKGQYFMRVTAKNESGYSQYAFDYYVVDSNKYFGIKCFYVENDGKIVEDIYVEG